MLESIFSTMRHSWSITEWINLIGDSLQGLALLAIWYEVRKIRRKS